MKVFEVSIFRGEDYSSVTKVTIESSLEDFKKFKQEDFRMEKLRAKLESEGMEKLGENDTTSWGLELGD